MIRAYCLSALLTLAALPSVAETATIRSGEHPDYSRVVVEPEGAAGWTLGRTGAGYELRFERAGIDFDLAGAFARIPRTRLADLAQAGDSRLAITVAAGHHVRAFETARGVAIDVYAGAPPAGSPWEAALPAAAPAPATVAQAPVAPAVEPVAVVPPEPVAAPVLPTRRPEPRPPVVAALASAAAAVLGAAPPPEPEPAAPTPAAAETPLPEPAESETVAAADPAPAPILRTFRAPAAPDPRLDLYWRATLAPEAEAARPAMPEPQSAPEPRQALPAPAPAEPRPLDRALEVNARVAEAETELLKQLSRATAQGLVVAEVPELRPAPETAPEPVAAEPEPLPVQPPGSLLADHLNVRSKTSIDRELSVLGARLPVTAEGRECLPDAAVDVGGWGDDRPMLIQLVAAREGLVGEFDRPDPAVADRLAKLYLHFGFGAEARQTLEVFGAPNGDAEVLREIAAIFDDGQADPAGVLAGMIDCDTAVALWAMLARADLGPSDTVNEAAAFRAFSALPLHLRLMLGELLADRFLALGSPDRARSVRYAILRAPGEHGLAVSMINARLELAEGNPRGAEPHLQDVAEANGPSSVDAILLYVEGRLRDGLPVDRAMVENAGALAFAMKGAAEAPALERAQALGLASNGDFAEAFAALARWRKAGIDPMQSTVKDELFAMLAAPEASQLFLTHYFANRDLIRPEEASAELRIALSERLLSFGFTDEARRMRGAEAGVTESGRLFLARAALADYDGAEALRQLDGFDGTEARRLRAEALRVLGRHDDAARAYLAAGAPEEAGIEAWRAGDWSEVATLDAGLRREAVTAFGLVPGVTPTPLAAPPEPGPDGEAPGPLARNRALVEESRAARALIDALLADAGEITVEN